MTKPTMWLCAQLRLRPVWSESSLCAQWVAKDPSFLHADSENSDQTGRMPRLIWVFAGRTATLLVLSCRGLFYVHPSFKGCTLTVLWYDWSQGSPWYNKIEDTASSQIIEASMTLEIILAFELNNRKTVVLYAFFIHQPWGSLKFYIKSIIP